MFCPEGCVNKDHDIDYDYCKGCGICKEECPVQAIKMEIE
jgi:pyruvate ferredoxin oxidoreductase delta subunit